MMSTLEEIRTAIVRLNPDEKALLVAELFAMNEPNDAELQSALDRGLDDVKAGRVRPIEDVKNMIPSLCHPERSRGTSNFGERSEGGSSTPLLDVKNNVGEAETLFGIARRSGRSTTHRKPLTMHSFQPQFFFLSLRERTEVRVKI